MYADDMWGLQIAREVACIAQNNGHPLRDEKIRVRALPGHTRFYVRYETIDGRRGLIVLPGFRDPAFSEHLELIGQRFPFGWEDPIC